MSKLFATLIVSCLTFASYEARGDIITLDYTFTNGSYTFNGMASPVSGNDAGLPIGPFTMSTTPGSFEVATLSVDATSTQFSVSYDFEPSYDQLGASTIFDFSDVQLTGGATLQSFAFNAGASSAGATDPGVTFTSGVNAFSFTTAGSDQADSLGDVLTYVFDFTDSSSSSAAVPEPSSFACLLLGGIGLYARRRRRS
jgi:hypothetical protein